MNRPSPLIRWLHAAVAISVLLCMVSALIMNTRTASTTFTGALFVVHKYVGINLGILLVCYLALSKYGVGKSLGDLWPWFSPRKLRLLQRCTVSAGFQTRNTEHSDRYATTGAAQIEASGRLPNPGDRSLRRSRTTAVTTPP